MVLMMIKQSAKDTKWSSIQVLILISMAPGGARAISSTELTKTFCKWKYLPEGFVGIRPSRCNIAVCNSPRAYLVSTYMEELALYGQGSQGNELRAETAKTPAMRRKRSTP
jgi:hypothetical protein